MTEEPRPTGSTPSGGKQSLWEKDGGHSAGMKKVQKSMANLGMNQKVGIMKRQSGPGLSPLERAWRSTPTDS